MAYFGGKTRLAARIAALLPKHDHYVEPYAGSLAVLLAKPMSRMETVNDLDHELMTFWRVLRNKPEHLARVCALTPHSRAEHLAAFDVDYDSLDELEIARLVWVRINQGRSGTLRKTGWRYYVNPGATNSPMTDYLAAYVTRMAAAAERLQHVSLECRPALEVIDKFGRFDANCLYVDPPYLAETRSSGTYQTEMSSPEEHEQLLEALQRARASVVLSGYASDLYDVSLSDWCRIEIPTTTGQGGTRQDRTEVIWSNRDINLTPTFDFGDAS